MPRRGRIGPTLLRVGQEQRTLPLWKIRATCIKPVDNGGRRLTAEPRSFQSSDKNSASHSGDRHLARSADAALAALAVAPPAYAALELSSPMLIFRPPTHAELYAAYRNRRLLVAAGALSGTALFWRALAALRRSHSRGPNHSQLQKAK
jgi:hypothetical protein